MIHPRHDCMMTGHDVENRPMPPAGTLSTPRAGAAVTTSQASYIGVRIVSPHAWSGDRIPGDRPQAIGRGGSFPTVKTREIRGVPVWW